jgi:hypothetical protein
VPQVARFVEEELKIDEAVGGWQWLPQWSNCLQLFVDQPLCCCVHQEVLTAQEVYANDREPHFCITEPPAMK